MCLLTFYPAGVMPDIQALRNGAATNDDGHGYGIIVDGEVVTGHSMDFETVADEFRSMRAMYPLGEAMFHSRWTTHGLTVEANCHPFTVPQVRNTVVAHNGVLPFNAQPPKGDWRSDTRLFAEDILMHRFPVLDSPRTQRRLEKWLGAGNKILVLTTDPRYKKQAYLFNEKAGIWVDGIWYSNDAYLPRPVWVKVGDKWERQIDGVHVPYDYSPRHGGAGTWDSYFSDDDSRWRSWEDEYRDEMRQSASGLHYVDSTGRRYYSGTGREGSYPESTVIGYESRSGQFEKYQCGVCGSFDINAEFEYEMCLACESCLVCSDSIHDCNCFPGRVEILAENAALQADAAANGMIVDAEGQLWPLAPSSSTVADLDGKTWQAATKAASRAMAEAAEAIEAITAEFPATETLAIRDRSEAEFLDQSAIDRVIAEIRSGKDHEGRYAL